MSSALQSVSLTACAAEYIAMTLFVIIGCGSAANIAGEEGWLLQVSLTFGFAITSLAYAVGHFSGGHINCAVTLGLVLAGQCDKIQGAANVAAQMMGSLTGAILLCLVVPKSADKTHGLGSNGISPKFDWHNAIVGEVVMTFLLVYVVLETACHPRSASNRPQACIAIGFAVFLAHTVLIPIDGCSINPTRSFGPAVVATFRYADSKAFKDMWIFWAGPLLGATGAALTFTGLSKVFPSSWEGEEPERQATDVDVEFSGEVCDDKAEKDGRPDHVAMHQDLATVEQRESPQKKTWFARWFRSDSEELSGVVPSAQKDLDGITIDVEGQSAAQRATWRERWFGRAAADASAAAGGKQLQASRVPKGNVLCGGSAPTEDGENFACCMFFRHVVAA